ncbi:heme ABC transporter ATP-binding protein [Amorphus orientalis]|uniref:Iron complex transport system ATP-binding protein n=1 Tax=Amorphus orientalis TaxID=649198 RepID=A0AAE3VRP9_9HYPH|nr:heme ABC transporter ATP-binding protein [Amorphus orientalis]MDQ0316913.1 iron complex transport system ATP-binding protein [Amorphus orientalis]
MLTSESLGVYRGRWLLRDVSVRAEAGQTVAVIGPNGAGKSTLMKALAGEFRPEEGRVLLDGADIAGMSRQALAQRRAVLPQASVLAFPFTVREVAALGISVPSFPIPRARREQLVDRALEAVELSDLAGSTFDILSGGEKQRAQLARVLCQLWACEGQGTVPALFLDEPTASQDLAHQLSVLEIARRHARQGGAVVAVLHDLNLTAAWADRIVVMQNGSLYSEGTPQEVLTERMLAEVFHVRLTPGTVPDRTPYVLPQQAEPMRRAATG